MLAQWATIISDYLSNHSSFQIVFFLLGPCLKIFIILYHNPQISPNLGTCLLPTYVALLNTPWGCLLQAGTKDPVEAMEKKKRRTLRKYMYRGVDLDQLLDMSR